MALYDPAYFENKKNDYYVIIYVHMYFSKLQYSKAFFLNLGSYTCIRLHISSLSMLAVGLQLSKSGRLD